MSNKLLIEVSKDDQIYVENVCTTAGYTFGSFFSHLLSLYKRSLNEPMYAQGEEPKVTSDPKIKKLKPKE